VIFPFLKSSCAKAPGLLSNFSTLNTIL
jgi:hypothetical protein